MHRRRELRLCTGWPTSNGGGLQTTAEPERQCGVGGAELPRPLHVRYGQPPCDVWEAWPGRCGPAVSLPLLRESHAKAGRLWSVTHHLRWHGVYVCWNYVRLRLGFSIRSPGRLARGGSSVLVRARPWAQGPWTVCKRGQATYPLRSSDLHRGSRAHRRTARLWTPAKSSAFPTTRPCGGGVMRVKELRAERAQPGRLVPHRHVPIARRAAQRGIAPLSAALGHCGEERDAGQVRVRPLAQCAARQRPLHTQPHLLTVGPPRIRLLRAPHGARAPRRP